MGRVMEKHVPNYLTIICPKTSLTTAGGIAKTEHLHGFIPAI